MCRIFLCSAFLLTFSTFGAFAATPEELIQRIRATGKEGKGNADASVAWKELVALGESALFPTLTAIGTSEPIPANWLRSAIDAMAQKAKQEGKPLPAQKLEAYVVDRTNPASSRRLAYELLVSLDAQAPDRLLKGMLDDPSTELRRDAIAAMIAKTEPLISSDPKTAAKVYRQLFAASRDPDQVQAIAKTLDQLKVEYSLIKHFNLIDQWWLCGPFESANGTGWNRKFEPEFKVDLSASYEGKGGKPISWIPATTTDKLGVVDLNKLLGKHKGAVAYAFAAVESATEQDVEFRVGSIVAVKVFLNGENLFEKEEYHHGMSIDQYIVKAKLKPGRNEILLKLTQNEQTEQWAQKWEFSFRICDATGGAVPVRLLQEKPVKKEGK